MSNNGYYTENNFEREEYEEIRSRREECEERGSRREERDERRSRRDECDERSRRVECDETHNHEFLTSTNYKKNDECEVHNHRTAGITGPARPYGRSHVHDVEVFVDTFDCHIHKICDVTGPALRLPNGKHIHLIKGETTICEGHKHAYDFVTLIDNPSDVHEDRC